MVCFDSTTCDTCIKNYVFLNKNGSAACVDWSIATYGQVANISGFTSNVTTIVSKVYVTSSVGPVIAGQMSSTYFNIEFCQFLYFHSSSSSGNSELENFLSSLQSVSLTSSSATANNTAQGRLLVPAEYTSTFLETNAPIFILMGCFLLANLGVFLFQRYVDYCCFSCKRLHFYLSEVC